MDNGMYFITLIAQAFEQPDRDSALKQAFEKIRSLGRDTEYSQGYQQFEIFMELVESHIKKNKDKALWDNVVRVFMIELATDGFEGDQQQKDKIQKIIESDPKWQKEYESLVKEIGVINEPFNKVEISVLRDEKTVGKVSLTKQSNSDVIDKILPGIYKIVLSTGRLLWQGSLDENDLLWSKAFEGEPLKMAADSDGIKSKPAKSMDILNGEIKLNVFAGIETGSLEIRMNF